jgi:hypothetical protein
MKARPSWIRKVYIALAMLAVAMVILFAYGYYQITSPIDLGGPRLTNILDAKEAEKKLKLYKSARQVSERGFVRLSEVEINSYLQEHYFSSSKGSGISPAATASARLMRTHVLLTDEAVIWLCWMQKKWLGRSVDLVWQRAFEIVPDCEGNSTLRMTAMRVGQLDVPASFWGVMRSTLGEVDGVFTNQFNWLTRLPTLEIKTNAASFKPELRLFTYRVTDTP